MPNFQCVQAKESKPLKIHLVTATSAAWSGIHERRQKVSAPVFINERNIN